MRLNPLGDQFGLELGRFVHFVHVGSDFRFREFTDGLAKEFFLFGKDGEGLGCVGDIPGAEL